MRGGGSRRRFSIRDCSRSAGTTRSSDPCAGRLVSRHSPVFLSRCLPDPRTQLSLSIVVLLAMIVVAGCRRGADVDGKPPSPIASPPVHQPAQNELFTDRAKETGLDFVYFNGMAGDFYFPEMMGGGVALFDYDNDGDLDVFYAQG